MKKNVKILVCYHKPFPLLKDEILTPIHLGRANANQENSGVQWLMDNMIGDDTGENISKKNAYYNEMTALYWAWKNYDKLGNPDYIGLAHYRRHFVMEENVEKTYSIRYYDKDNILEVLDYTPEKLMSIISDCDFITHLGRVYNLYQHYIDNQRKKDIDVAMEILAEKYPDYKATADAYMEGQISNFYNMNIFSKELFFKYCEFVFSIMEEFEIRIPSVRNRRMFISERLTAIFVKKLMDDGEYKFKYLPVAFIEEPLDINIAVYVSENNIERIAVSIQSILHYSNEYNKYIFYLFKDEFVDEKYLKTLQEMIEEHCNCCYEIIEYKNRADQLPFLLSFMIPKINKCLLISESIIATTDIAEFYRLVVVDDFFVSGIPEIKYDQYDMNKTIVSDMMILNCKRIRSNTQLSDYIKLFSDDINGIILLNRIWKDEIKYIAYYWYISERLFTTESHVYVNGKTRQQMQIEAKWCPIILYDSMDPLVNAQGIYAKFWWDMYQEIPVEFKQLSYSEETLERVWKKQLDEIWLKQNYNVVNFNLPSTNNVNKENPFWNQNPEDSQKEDWRNYGIWGKLKFYYKYNGMKNTIKYVSMKIFGRKGEN